MTVICPRPWPLCTEPNVAYHSSEVAVPIVIGLCMFTLYAAADPGSVYRAADLPFVFGAHMCEFENMCKIGSIIAYWISKTAWFWGSTQTSVLQRLGLTPSPLTRACDPGPHWELSLQTP